MAGERFGKVGTAHLYDRRWLPGLWKSPRDMRAGRSCWAVLGKVILLFSNSSS